MYYLQVRYSFQILEVSTEFSVEYAESNATKKSRSVGDVSRQVADVTDMLPLSDHATTIIRIRCDLSRSVPVQVNRLSIIYSELDRAVWLVLDGHLHALKSLLLVK